MTVNVTGGLILTHVSDPALNAKLDMLNAKLDQVLAKESQMAATLNDVLDETKRGTTIESSMETFIAGLQAQITAAGGNAAQIQQIFDTLKANNDKAAAAIVTNTPSAVV